MQKMSWIKSLAVILISALLMAGPVEVSMAQQKKKTTTTQTTKKAAPTKKSATPAKIRHTRRT